MHHPFDTNIESLHRIPLLFIVAIIYILRCMAKVHLIGVDNLSPNSIAGQFPDPAEAIAHARSMFEEYGVTWVDLGAQATNPWAKLIPVEQEWERFEAVVPALLAAYPGRISIDSFRPEIHERIARLRLGPHIWNDITNLNDPDSRERAIHLYKSGAVSKFIISHLAQEFGRDFKRAHAQGRIDNPKLVLKESLHQHTQLLLGGVKARDIITGPGIGFGKTMRTNWQLVGFGKMLPPQMPVEIGFSHKRMLTTREDGQPLSKDKDYNEAQKTNAARHHDVAEMAIKAAGNRDVYLRVHEPEWYQDLITQPE